MDPGRVGGRYVGNQRDLSLTALVVIFAICLGLFIAVASWINGRRKMNPPPPKVVDAFAGGYPVPPLPGQRLAEERPRVTVPAKAAELSGSDDDEGWTMPEMPQAVKGFRYHLQVHVQKKVVTVQYPEEKQPVKPRFHGRHQLNRHPDGLEKMRWLRTVRLGLPGRRHLRRGAPNTDEERFSPGERYGRVYQINYLRCIFCGLCIEACPHPGTDDDPRVRTGR